jgi:hypothetical protein
VTEYLNRRGETAELFRHYIQNSTVNRITNSDMGETLNTFDMFKLEGRPLYKIKNK